MGRSMRLPGTGPQHIADGITVGTDAPDYRQRICRACGMPNPWKDSCRYCGAAFGRVTFGLDRLAENEAALPMEMARVAASNRKYRAMLARAKKDKARDEERAREAQHLAEDNERLSRMLAETNAA